MLNAVQLGKNSGLRVSELCLGTMNFGQPGKGHQGDWTLGLDDASEGATYFERLREEQQVQGDYLRRFFFWRRAD